MSTSTWKNLKMLLGVLAALAAFAPGVSARPQPDAAAPGAAAARELRFGLASELTTLDPLDPGNTADGRAVLFNVYEGLVKPDTQGRLLPALASSFEAEAGGLAYRFTLRPGVRFHDGTTVTPDDVAFTLNAAKAARYTGFADIDRIETVGGDGVLVTLRNPDPEFLPYLTIGIVPAHNADRAGSPVGTGPFRIERYAPQQSLTLVRNTDYWQPGVPQLDRVTIVFMADSAALQIGLQGGNIDAATVTGQVLNQLDLSRFEVFENFSNMIQIFALNNAVPPLDDVRVRRAVNYAVDAREIIDLAFYGRGTPSGSPVIPGLAGVYEPSLTAAYPPDPDRARSLLAEAGYPDGFSMEIAVPSNYTMHVDTAQVIVDQLARVGIRAAINQVEWASWLTDVYRGRKFQSTIISFDGSSVPLSPRSFLNRYVSTTGSNFIGFNSQDYDRVYAAALAEPDEARRVEFYREAQRVAVREAASVFLQDILSFTVCRKGFHGVRGYPLNVIDFAGIYRD